MNIISVLSLSKAFQGKSVLRDLSFDIRAHTITALLGNSGSGKTTLLRCLCQLEKQDSGTITHHKKNVPRDKIGMVFQHFNLWEHMTILENVIITPLQVLKVSKKTAIQEAEDLLEQLGILDKKNQYPAQLSSGEQQRAAIARTFLMKPDVLLFDEPTSALDPERTQSVANIIHFFAQKNMTMVIATHDIAFASQIATQIIFLEHGIIQEIADVQNNKILAKSERFLQFLRGSASILDPKEGIAIVT